MYTVHNVCVMWQVMQVNDSSVIVSALYSKLADPVTKLEEVMDCYPAIRSPVSADPSYKASHPPWLPVVWFIVFLIVFYSWSGSLILSWLWTDSERWLHENFLSQYIKILTWTTWVDETLLTFRFIDGDGKEKEEIQNKYFLMYNEAKINRTKEVPVLMLFLLSILLCMYCSNFEKYGILNVKIN